MRLGLGEAGWAGPGPNMGAEARRLEAWLWPVHPSWGRKGKGCSRGIPVPVQGTGTQTGTTHLKRLRPSSSPCRATQTSEGGRGCAIRPRSPSPSSRGTGLQEGCPPPDPPQGSTHALTPPRPGPRWRRGQRRPEERPRGHQSRSGGKQPTAHPPHTRGSVEPKRPWGADLDLIASEELHLDGLLQHRLPVPVGSCPDDLDGHPGGP